MTYWHLRLTKLGMRFCACHEIEATLKKSVVDMREKMRGHLGGKKVDRFMLKQDTGGITDIEFLAQYLVLRYSNEKPKLTRWCDNVRIFESLLSQGIMDEQQGMALTNAYTTLRDEIPPP